MSTSGSQGSVEGASASPSRLPARAAIDRAAAFADPARISGWILHPQQPLSRVAALLDGVSLGEAPLRARPDVAAAFPAVPHAALSGFEFNGFPQSEPAEIREVRMIGRSADGAAEAVRECTVTNRYPGNQDPPPHLVRRISGAEDLDAFYVLGFQCAADVRQATEPSLRDQTSPTILDWGCGCGRLAMHLRRHWPTASIRACDVDGEAVDWCASNLPDIDAFVCGPEPPLPLAADSVDLVIGSSVMTHLDPSTQQAWLEELHRVLRPGGSAALSVHGDFAAAFHGPEFSAKVAARGIVDLPDDALEGVLPSGYYRATFQSQVYTIATFAAKLQLREYRVAGFGRGLQDLVVLQKPS